MVYDRSRHQSEDLGRVWVSLIAESGPLFTDLFFYLQATSAIR